MAWIESHDTLARHPKTKRLMRALNIGRAQAIGHLHLLWYFCGRHRPHGRLDDLDVINIAGVACWERDPQTFVDALVTAGWIDVTPTGFAIHDWDEWSGPAVRRQHRDLERLNDEYQELRRQVIARDGLVCGLCGGPVARADVHIDHIQPRSLGGPDTLDNLRVTHSRCNLQRGNRVDWTPEITP